jgi:hypothetical protein
VCFRGGKAPTRRNLGAASLISFVMVAKISLPADEAQSRCSFSEPARADSDRSRHAGRNNRDGSTNVRVTVTVKLWFVLFPGLGNMHSLPW